MYLVTGAGGGVGSVSRSVVQILLGAGQPVRAMVHRDDARADQLREIGAEVVVGDLANPADVADVMRDVHRMFFSMSVSPDYLQLQKWYSGLRAARTFSIPRRQSAALLRGKPNSARPLSAVKCSQDRTAH